MHLAAATARRARAGAIVAGALVAAGALLLAPSALAKGGDPPPSADHSPAIAYVTQTASSPASVWVTRADGSETRRLGPGAEPLIAPSGRQVAASLFGAGASTESGPALAIYSTEGAAPLLYLNLATASATPLAWSPDLRYVAVALSSTTGSTRGSGLVVIDLGTNTVRNIASGQISGASFAPDGSDRIVYGRSPSQSLSAPVNLFLSGRDGSGVRALTRDGRSLNPVWGNHGIAYDRERLRRNDAPVYQIWLRSPSGSSLRRLTNVRVPSLVSGLVPLAFSTDGTRLLAEFEGQDTSEAWTVRVLRRRAHRLTVRGRPVQGAGISRDGRTLLLEQGGFAEPASNGRVATIPFAGGRATVLVAHGAQASWNG